MQDFQLGVRTKRLEKTLAVGMACMRGLIEDNTAHCQPKASEEQGAIVGLHAQAHVHLKQAPR